MESQQQLTNEFRFSILETSPLRINKSKKLKIKDIEYIQKNIQIENKVK